MTIGRSAPRGTRVEISDMANAKKNEYKVKIEGYKRVNEMEIEELRRSTPEINLRQFAYLMDLAKAMDWHVHTPEEIEEVRRRWQKLKGYGG
jgi:hypothetical protein